MKKLCNAMLVFLITIITLGLSGCYPQEKAVPTKTQEVKVQETAAERAIKKLTKNFLTEIMEGNLLNMEEYVLLPKNSFVTGDDIAWYLPRSEVADLVACKQKFEITKIEAEDKEDEKNIAKKVSIKAGGREYLLNVKLDEMNQWKFTFSDMFLSDWKFVVSDNVTVYINDIKVTDAYIEGTYTGTDAPNNHCIIYSLPHVIKREVTVTLVKGTQKVHMETTPSEYTTILDCTFPKKK